MSKVLIVIFLFPLLGSAQLEAITNKADLTKIYSLAITDFIKAANKKNKTNFDTLYIGKRVNGEPDDFPDINLPKVIEQTQIRIVTPEVGAKKQKQRKASIYVNLIGWSTTEYAEFIFVVFSNGLAHQYDYSIKYKYNAKNKVFDLEKLEFISLPSGK
jgi:hypothetical protein